MIDDNEFDPGPRSYVPKGTPVQGKAEQENWVDEPEPVKDLSNVIPFKAKRAAEPKCSFCQVPKSQARGGYLINSNVGPHLICVSCVEHCTERLKTDKELA